MPPRAPDTNPYAVPGPWPRLPQAPFRIGPLPKAIPDRAPPPPSRGVLSGSAIPMPASRPARPPEPTPEEPAAIAPAAYTPQPRPIPDAPVANSVLARTSRPTAGKSRLPLIAGGVAAALVAAIAAVSLSNRPPAPVVSPGPAAPIAVATAPPVSPAPPVTTAKDLPPPAAPPRQARLASVRVPVARAPVSIAAPAVTPIAEPAPLIVPPVEAAPAPRAAAPLPTDPETPMTTRTPADN